ncbi:ABC transporter, permease protein [Acidisarcina polymorpha]|uniref:ABC transporter, permease protein n=1 Tax=Acidisarcina polymorpha TaxID=2211140 RepID=A0A2Z5FVQ0_9BACT|nr:ABC transporter permease [Acidisarcina polymorpha]AXC10574.1 ABC transporter, permease protein [Acidisarcina polymorpha]
MAILRSFVNGIQALLHREARNEEIQEELQSYLEASAEEKIRRGMDRETAWRATRAEIGSVEAVRHKVWSATWESNAEALWQDLRYGARQLLKSPGFSIVAILSLALGTGANTAIFTLINDLLLKSLPVRDAWQLVSFGHANGGGTLGAVHPGAVDIFSYDFYKHLEEEGRRRPEFFQGICAFSSFPVMVSVRSSAAASSPATQAMTHLVSGTFFSVLGANPLLGRAITATDSDAPGRSAVAVISYRYWQQALAADPGVIGRSLNINGTLFRVIGVMPASFYGVDLNEQSPEMWLPLSMQAEAMLQPPMLDSSGLYWLHLMGRRNPKVSLSQSQAWATAQYRQFEAEREGTQIAESRRKEIRESFVELLPGRGGISHLRAAYGAPLAVLMGIVAIVLLIACANLANFMLAKAAAREREYSTRLALGSSRSRLARQVLTETLLLAFVGGGLGLVLAYGGTFVLIKFIAGEVAHSALSPLPDLRVLGFTAGICLLTGLFFGIAPALRISRIQVAGALKSRYKGSTDGGRLLPNLLVTGQIVLSLVLLAVAGLFLRTLHNLHSEDLGFDRRNILLVKINAKFAGYKPDQLNTLYARILSRVDALPGVSSAALSGAAPMWHGNWGSPITILGRPAAPNEDVSTLLNRISPDYFETLGIPLLRGRTIRAADTAASPQAVVVNQTFADRYFPHSDAIGHSFTIADPSVKGVWQIVGVVGNATYNHAGEVPEAMAYLAVMQLTEDDQYAYWLQVRTSGDPAAIAGEVRAGLAEIDPNLPILDVETISEQLDHLIDEQRLVSQLSGFFSLLALSLCAIGLYGVMTYSVVRRTNEFGVRLALGASSGGVLWLVLRQSLGLLGMGIALGVPATLVASQAIQAGLYGLKPSDPLTLIGSILMIAIVSVTAAYFPARRATRVDPAVALRYE